MLARKAILGVLAVLIVELLLAGQSLSQLRQDGQMRGMQDQRPTSRQFDPERMRQMMEQRIQQQLGASDQEWKVLRPHVMKVSELSRQLSGGGRSIMFGGGRRSGPQDNKSAGRQGASARELTEVEKASEQLRTLLENTFATQEQIKEQITVLRAAKKKVEQELVAAQQKLQKIATARQEAQLVLMGILD